MPAAEEGTLEGQRPGPAMERRQAGPQRAAPWLAALEEAYRPGCSAGSANSGFVRLEFGGFGFAGSESGSSQAGAAGSGGQAGPDLRSAPERRAGAAAGS